MAWRGDTLPSSSFSDDDIDDDVDVDVDVDVVNKNNTNTARTVPVRSAGSEPAQSPFNGFLLGSNDMGFHNNAFIGFMTSTAPLVILLPLFLMAPFFIAAGPMFGQSGPAQPPPLQQPYMPQQAYAPQQPQPIYNVPPPQTFKQMHDQSLYQRESNSLHNMEPATCAAPDLPPGAARTMPMGSRSTADPDGLFTVRINAYLENEKRVILLRSSDGIETLLGILGEQFQVNSIVVKYQYGGELFDILTDTDLYAALHSKEVEFHRFMNLFVWTRTSRSHAADINDTTYIQFTRRSVPLLVSVVIAALGYLALLGTAVLTSGPEGKQAAHEWDAHHIDWDKLFKTANKQHLLLAESLVYIILGGLAVYVYNVDLRAMWLQNWTHIMPLLLGLLYGSLTPFGWQSITRQFPFLNRSAVPQKRQKRRATTATTESPTLKRTDTGFLVTEAVHEMSIVWLGFGLFLPACYEATNSIYIAVIASQMLLYASRDFMQGQTTIGLGLWVLMAISFASYLPVFAQYAFALVWGFMHFSTPNASKPRYDLWLLLLWTDSLPAVLAATFAASPLFQQQLQQNQYFRDFTLSDDASINNINNNIHNNTDTDTTHNTVDHSINNNTVRKGTTKRQQQQKPVQTTTTTTTTTKHTKVKLVPGGAASSSSGGAGGVPLTCT